jgi:hypothetical protein
MKNRQWSVQCHTRATADAQRRWDQAYQHLIRWSAACLREVPQGHIRQEGSNESSNLCACVYATAGANADH